MQFTGLVVDLSSVYCESGSYSQHAVTPAGFITALRYRCIDQTPVFFSVIEFFPVRVFVIVIIIFQLLVQL